MTDEVGVVTGDLTLETAVGQDNTVTLRVQYKGADEWYHVSDARIKASDAADVPSAEQTLLGRFG